jgi:serine kinase of HPr protein (carbohydrate metabolism regulator)
MANAPEDSVLITIQAHKNTVAVAALAEIRAIVICNRRSVPQNMIDTARMEGIAIFKTDQTQFEVSNHIGELLEE